MSGLAQLRAVLRLVARGYGSKPGDMATAPRRRQAVERAGILPSPADLRRYLAVTTGEQTGGAAALPPLYSSTWETLLALELLSVLDPAIPFGAVVHGETSLLIARPAPVGEPLRCRVELERMEPVRSGVRIEVSARNWASGDRLCSESRHTFRLRTGGEGGGRRQEEPLAMEGWRRLTEWKLDGGAGRRFARVSGDWNPIHLWPLTSRPLGFRRPILHGFCTAAMAAHALSRELWGEPAALRRFSISFRAPLALPGSATLWLRDGEVGHAFRVTDPDALRLFAEGECGGGGTG